jgi:hypothetical protein
VPGMFCSNFVGSVTVPGVLQYNCGRCDSVPGVFCSTAVGGVVVCLVCCAVHFLAVW